MLFLFSFYHLFDKRMEIRDSLIKTKPIPIHIIRIPKQTFRPLVLCHSALSRTFRSRFIPKEFNSYTNEGARPL